MGAKCLFLKGFSMEIEMVPIEKVRLCCGNFPRGECNIEKVAKSLKEFGWQQPIMVDITHMVVAGHTRLLAAQKLRLRKVPVHVLRNATPAQIKHYRDYHAVADQNLQAVMLTEADVEEFKNAVDRKFEDDKRKRREARAAKKAARLCV